MNLSNTGCRDTPWRGRVIKRADIALRTAVVGVVLEIRTGERMVRRSTVLAAIRFRAAARHPARATVGDGVAGYADTVATNLVRQTRVVATAAMQDAVDNIDTNTLATIVQPCIRSRATDVVALAAMNRARLARETIAAAAQRNAGGRARAHV